MLPRRARAPLMRAAAAPGVESKRFGLLLVGIVAAVGGLVFISVRRPFAQPPSLLERLRQHEQQQRQRAASTRAERTAAGVPGAEDAAPGSFQWADAQRVAAAAAYERAVLQPRRPRAVVPPSRYVIQPEPHDMRRQHSQVAAHLASAAFKARLEDRRRRGERGIILNAGGPRLLSSAIVSLKVLREELNCSLPVELVWHTPHEMDAATLSTLQARFGPLRGVDLSSLPWPAHHRDRTAATGASTAAAAAAAAAGAATEDAAAAAGGGALPAERAAAKQAGFVLKVLSLTVSSFASALLLDADNLPLADPAGLWDDASFAASGSLFWPDFWRPGLGRESQEVVYDLVGLEFAEASALLAAGKGRLPRRGTESGQLLLDLVRHGDVAEWALWINSFGDSIYRAVFGDKDTYCLAFAVAGKAHAFNQLEVPPGAALTWRPASLLVKATQERVAGWQLAGMVQFTPRGQPAFLHRTMNKFAWGTEPWRLGLLTGPLTYRWVQYYLAQDSQGPTVGASHDYAAPAAALVPWSLPAPLCTSAPAGPDATQWRSSPEEDCPAATFVVLWRMREHALPLGASPALEASCAGLLAALLGPAAASYAAANLTAHPELLALGGRAFDQLLTAAPHAAGPALDDAAEEASVPDATPAPAWALPQDAAGLLAPAVPTRVAAAIAASYAAFDWLRRAGAAEFPLLAGPAGPR